MTFSVICGDLAADEDDEDAEWVVDGFASQAMALEYARRFIRAQIEDLRRTLDHELGLKETYLAFGEYALTEGFDPKAWVEYCIDNPASRRAETDYEALDPNA